MITTSTLVLIVLGLNAVQRTSGVARRPARTIQRVRQDEAAGAFDEGQILI